MKTYTEYLEATQAIQKIIIICSGEVGKTIKEMMDHIKSTTNGGHSFEIVVDPEDRERKKSFSIDGDGADRIESVSISGSGD